MQCVAKEIATFVHLATLKKEFGDTHCNIIHNPTTACDSGYHNANAANNTTTDDYYRGHAEALANLASATESE